MWYRDSFLLFFSSYLLYQTRKEEWHPRATADYVPHVFPKRSITPFFLLFPLPSFIRSRLPTEIELSSILITAPLFRSWLKCVVSGSDLTRCDEPIARVRGSNALHLMVGCGTALSRSTGVPDGRCWWWGTCYIFFSFLVVKWKRGKLKM
ncbi:hypothetical protein I7I50_07764 [Histoplasma capsulatum G186AR]|uniref:Uncharacterized protein n=1 Tax=Ajellomyces capsulatus TaxID=5037 RepID=A0A8H7YV14_AJECA|nr:hypothetical protein I7I52_09163 [Histoplasma capsulatum]QSS68376.1 hypothetical protein I7I50_07764 [Histoplasma capsulatum G186AR]